MDQRWKIGVRTDGDTIRAERHTRNLRDTLAEIAGIQVELARDNSADNDGHKGGIGDLSLWVTMAGTTAPVAITAIKEWCARDRHRKVEVTRDGASTSVTIVGEPTEAQERIIRHLVEPPARSQRNGAVDS